eukprot:5663657-Prymnesium_polylepis.1
MDGRTVVCVSRTHGSWLFLDAREGRRPKQADGGRPGREREKEGGIGWVWAVGPQSCLDVEIRALSLK